MKVEPQRYRLAFTMNPVFFPLTEPDFSDLLKENGYTLGGTIPPVFRAGSRAYTTGRMALKDGCAVDVDANGKLVRSEGRSAQKVAGIMEELISLMKKEFRISLKKDLHYLELIADLIVISEKNPLRTMARISEDYAIRKDFDTILGVDTSLYSLAIVPRDVLPNSPKWFDIRISPRHTTPTREYYVTVVFRDKDVRRVLDYTRQVNTRVKKLITRIERD